MLGYVVFVLIVLLASVTAIWLYRLVSGWQSSKRSLVDRNKQTAGKKISTQLGYISPFSASRKEKQKKRPRRLKSDPKTPWGW
jgi:hypothetical protein